MSAQDYENTIGRLDDKIAELEKSLLLAQKDALAMSAANTKLQTALAEMAAKRAELREATQDVLEDVEHGAIGKDDLCLTQLAALLQESSDEH